MNNLIIYKGGSTFLLLQNVPEHPSSYMPSEELDPAFPSPLGYNELVKYRAAMKACEESAKEIINTEEIERKLYQNDKRVTGPMSFDAWRRIILKTGDTFPLPEGILFKEEVDKSGVLTRSVIRLYASKGEEKKVRPLKEHFEIETDAGTTLRTFDYIAALEEYIDSIDLNKNI